MDRCSSSERLKSPDCPRRLRRLSLDPPNVSLPSKAEECLAGVASLPLSHGNVFGPICALIAAKLALRCCAADQVRSQTIETLPATKSVARGGQP